MSVAHVKSVAQVRLVALVCVCLSAVQPLCYAQSSVTISGDHAEVTAGKLFTLHLTFDTAATCDHAVSFPLANAQAGQGFVLRGSLRTGKDAVDVSARIPNDVGGKFSSGSGMYGIPYLEPCDGYSVGNQLKAPVITVNVKPIPDPNSHPSVATVQLTLTQAQFLQTKIAQLNELSIAIDTRLEENGRDSAALRSFLAGVIKQASADLMKTEQEYRGQLLKSDEELPAFFADFRRQYADLYTEVMAPIPGAHASAIPRGDLIYVQQTLKNRSSSDVPIRSGNRAGTTTMAAKAVKSTLQDNASAYGVVQTKGRATFYASFESFPTGASLYYRQAIEPDFKMWSKPTNISGADFTLATFIFKFHRDDCDDEPVVVVDPYDNTTPDVSVEFKKCRKR